MIIFIPMFLIMFVIVPILLTWMACDLFGVRRFPWKVMVFALIAVLNWQMWQAPKEGQPQGAPTAVARLLGR